jgi:hypothetical protein
MPNKVINYWYIVMYCLFLLYFFRNRNISDNFYLIDLKLVSCIGDILLCSSLYCLCLACIATTIGCNHHVVVSLPCSSLKMHLCQYIFCSLLTCIYKDFDLKQQNWMLALPFSLTHRRTVCQSKIISSKYNVFNTSTAELLYTVHIIF